MQIRERFFNKVDKSGECWLWTGTDNGKGYGLFRTGSRTDGTTRMSVAHRISWVLEFGPIPAGKRVLHKCDVTRCVNPKHLFIGDQFDNMRDMVRKGRNYNSQKTHCPKNHAYNSENTRVYAYAKIHRNTQRICKQCSREYVRRDRASPKLKSPH